MTIVGKKLRRSGGFTLVEVVIASILLAIVVTGIAFFFMHIIRLSDRVDDQTRALEICRDGVEKLRTEDVVSMSNGWQTPETVEGFTRRVWIDTPYPLYPEAKLVMCRVNWSGVEGADSLDLSTIF
jgi:prepilin-type N-terminal cleavage/methylation domain-containing protein